MNENEILGQRLQACREAQGFTQQDMVKATGHTKHYISALENGKNKMSAATLIAYAKKLNVSIDELLGLRADTASGILPEFYAELRVMNAEQQKEVLKMLRAAKALADGKSGEGSS